MNSEEIFRKRLDRLQRWVDRAARAWQKTLSETEGQYLNVLRDLEEEKMRHEAELKVQEEQLKGQLDQAGKDYAKNKYLVEKQTSQEKAAIEEAKRDIEVTKQQLSAEIARINQEKLNNQISYERQKSALHELYHEKKRNLLVLREKLVREDAQTQSNYKATHERFTRELEKTHSEYGQKISLLKDQLSSKQAGWTMAVETMKKEVEALTHQREDIEKQLATIQSDKEKELHDLHMQMQVAHEQLDLDKVSLVEKAEEDQRQCEVEVRTLQEKVASAEKDLQTLILNKDGEKKSTEDNYQAEETKLKETLKNESEKRDYEQKLYAQEKSIKEKELNHLKEEYEKKKAQWDNQVKTLHMQKSLQDAEANSERMKTEREARVIVRSLEAKRDELRQRLNDLEARQNGLTSGAAKEMDLLKQRWQWRKDRLWTMWQSRLDVLKKERETLFAQLEQLQNSFNKEKEMMVYESRRHESQVEELGESLLKAKTEASGERRQRQIQLELEKTRIIAQIKECEVLVTDWMDKQKMTQAEFGKQKASVVEDLAFLDKYYRAQQDETELFLSAFQKALMLFKGELERYGIKQDAA